jgi:hypothetical protein
MWWKFCVGTSEATDLADWKPGAAEQAATLASQVSVYRLFDEVGAYTI